MKISVSVTEERIMDVAYLYIDIPVRYGEEDIPHDFPFRDDQDRWKVHVDLESKKIVDWPQGKSGLLSMKVCDEGTYRLLDEKKNLIAEIVEDYVPNGFIPGEYGDYIELDIAADGTIENWLENPDAWQFFK